jgi:hypothetical protein
MTKLVLNFNFFDDTKLQKTLDIDKAAMDDAGQGSPESSSEEFSPTEVAIEREIQNFFNDSIGKSNRDSLESLIASTSSLREADGHDGQISSLETDLNAIYAKEKQKIQNLHQKFRVDKDNLNFFKKEHNLRAPADLKSPIHKFWSIAIVSVMFIFESTVNTGFLNGALSGGIMGALSLAGVISFINIVASFIVGRFVIPNLSHKKKSKNNFAKVVLTFYVPLIVFINCSLGVLRSLLQNAQETFNSEALAEAALKAAWPFDNFATNSVESNALIIIGILFAVIAILDGLKFDEPYPGYAKFTRDSMKSEDALQEAKTKGFDTLYAMQKAGNDQILKFKEDRDNANTNWGNAIDSVQAGFQDYERWVTSLNKSGNILLNQYRSSNKKFRSTPAPIYFENKHDFGFEKIAKNQFFSLSAENISDEEKRSKMNEVNQIITSEYINATKKLNEIYNLKTKDFETLIEGLSR